MEWSTSDSFSVGNFEWTVGLMKDVGSTLSVDISSILNSLQCTLLNK